MLGKSRAKSPKIQEIEVKVKCKIYLGTQQEEDVKGRALEGLRIVYYDMGYYTGA